MALDQIWKQQLTLVTYGNEFLTQNLSFQRWLQHSIFNQHLMQFRDLSTQHLLAQHFQIWLEGLKKQGCYRISLHCSAILNDEKNPNPNVELLPVAHFIVSHEQNKKTAWILGKELPEWYNADNDYEIPENQKAAVRQEVFWKFELNPKLAKSVDTDLQQPNWDDIHQYTESELFQTRFAADLKAPLTLNQPYDGLTDTVSSTLNETAEQTQNLSLLPTDYQADFAHQSLHRLEALQKLIQQKIKHPYNDEGVPLQPDEQLNLRHFSQKLDDLTAKFVVKVANHYKTAKLTPVEIANPLDGAQTGIRKNISSRPGTEHKSAKTGTFALIFITVLICIVAYYFGL
ncbi:hypothetical protein [Acinetobacter sp. WCHAc010052]|uniref:hypothetical protein n=1 Tax=Acinetobacter sp. WCHAc010052 TaxID=2004647 RepID=UPI000B3CC6CA|nr:hypothetical protein [Acinetobacter sp. WCHAc010052]AXY59193.1 hypothetical protein CDG61_03515 [Acinetobacter sp. WCHAc010052]